MKYWLLKTELPLKLLILWLGISPSKYYSWQNRYGKLNEHNGWVPRDFWLEDWEKDAIVDFHNKNSLEGYRRLCFMMLDRDLVAVSPSSVYRVLSGAGLLHRWNKKANKKGTGFVQPLVPHDRGFTDYSWYSILMADGNFFVTRLKSNADVEYLLKRAGRKSPGVTNDQQIKLKGIDAPLRLVAYTDLETGQEYHFVTNAHHLKAAEVAAIYKERRQIELFFKWIKQNLKIKTFLGTSRNAVLTWLC